MAAPTFVTSVNTTSWAHAFASAQTLSFTTQVGDLLVVIGSLKSNADGMTVTDNTSGGALTWTQRVLVGPDTSHTEAYIWTATATTAQSLTVTLTHTGAEGVVWGGTGYQFRGHGGVGNTASGSGTSTAPNVNITTTGANSAVVMYVGDTNTPAVGSQVYRSNAGTFTQRTATVATNDDTSASEYTLYHGYHADAGAASTYALGMTTPSSQAWTLAAIEVLGVSSQSQAPRSMHQYRLRQAA
jgi:hypothetical protein